MRVTDRPVFYFLWKALKRKPYSSTTYASDITPVHCSYHSPISHGFISTYVALIVFLHKLLITSGLDFVS
jgi:hypothetical protein